MAFDSCYGKVKNEDRKIKELKNAYLWKLLLVTDFEEKDRTLEKSEQ